MINFASHNDPVHTKNERKSIGNKIIFYNFKFYITFLPVIKKAWE